MTAQVALNGHDVTRALVQVPAWGAWWADLDLAEDVTLSGRVSLQFADVQFSGTVVSGGPFNGRSAYRIVGGGGGWGKEIEARSYADDAGVKVSEVISDAASACGESVSGFPTTRPGPHYVRPSGMASLALGALAPRNWYVDFAGVTQYGQRASSQYAGNGATSIFDTAAGYLEIETDELLGLVPGVTISGSLPATDVEYSLEKGKISARVFCGRATSRRLVAFAKLMNLLDPNRAYRAVYEFRVVTQSGERLNLQPVRAASGMPVLQRVPVRPGIPGVKAHVALGERVLVAFADGLPHYPQVIAHEDADGPGWMPFDVTFGEAPALGVARQTDPVIAGPFGGTITLGSVRWKAGS